MIPLPILAIETSCDETSAAVLDTNCKILSHFVYSQLKEHEDFGGVVPEIASRLHLEILPKLVKKTVEEANVEVRSSAVTRGPGLIGSLLVGVSFAKGFAYSKNIPLFPVNHIEGHISSLFIGKENWILPIIVLIVSGGHTELYHITKERTITRIARTLDDAAGEAFDKASKMLGLGYPGGPAIAKAAEKSTAKAEPLTGTLMRNSIDFSFSGLKTALRNKIAKEKVLTSEKRNCLARAFQDAIVKSLVKKTEAAVDLTNVERIGIAGGVAANKMLRSAMERMAERKGIEILIPSIEFCTDNAVMIGASAIFNPRYESDSKWNALASWKL